MRIEYDGNLNKHPESGDLRFRVYRQEERGEVITHKVFQIYIFNMGTLEYEWTDIPTYHGD